MGGLLWEEACGRERERLRVCYDFAEVEKKESTG